MMIVSRPFVGSVIISRSGLFQFRYFIILYMTMLHFVHVLSAHFYAALTPYHCNAALEISIPNSGGIINSAQTSVHKTEIHITAVFKFCKVLVCKIRETRLHFFYITEQPIEKIDPV